MFCECFTLYVTTVYPSRRVLNYCFVCAAELVLIGYDARGGITEPTYPLTGTSNKAVLMSGVTASVRDPIGVLFGFVVGLSSSESHDVTSVRLQLWRPISDSSHQLVCQSIFSLPSNISYQVNEVAPDLDHRRLIV